jgi:hypothetical protein
LLIPFVIFIFLNLRTITEYVRVSHLLGVIEFFSVHLIMFF